jgi:periplasmic divalent cation tolerance protein
MMMVKSRRSLFKDIEAKVKELHPYDTPEIIAVDIKDGSREYLDWIDESVLKKTL